MRSECRYPETTFTRRSLLATPIPLLARQSVSSSRNVLQTEADRDAFRRWFTFLAEAPCFVTADRRPTEITDCSSLLRYAYREALRRHDSAWAVHSSLPLVPALPSVAEYNYPRTPTGPRLFRTASGAFAEFADAQTLCRYNCVPVARTLSAALPGDLLFYRYTVDRLRFHSMVVVGPSQITHLPEPMIVYDTGPDGTTSGEMKRLTFQELLHFPDARWRPIDRNPSFLGVYRWSIINRSA